MPLPARNLLSESTSPYLLQHKDNPVHWREWGPEALAEAQDLDRPILLSVGYAACHWCHVMAHESFEDPTTAELMNALFVNIKVDREERPDIDQIYMGALHAIGEPGGWPLTMFLTPQGEPFWGGTYFPPEARYGRPGFPQVLRAASEAYRANKEAVRQNTGAILQAIAQAPRAAGRQLDRAFLDQAADRLLTLVDPVNGGTRGAPKFPQASFLELLWRAYLRTGREQFRNAVLRTLERVCLGGIYDHLGGGFARYSVDERWLVPHFEKMLYDNAQLVELLTHAWLDTRDELFRVRVEETVDWLAREMTVPGGGFASSLDADSEGEEGKFYVWRPEEIETALGRDDAALFCRRYDVTERGNWEGVNVLNLLSSGRIPAEESGRLDGLRRRLFEVREARPRPGRDDKLLADWNGLAVAALARASTAFDRPDWLTLAQGAYRDVADAMVRDGRLGHAAREGRLTFPGLASDYGAMIRAALALGEATGEELFVAEAEQWAEQLARHHWIEDRGAFALAADDAEGVILRLSSAVDEAAPSANALAAEGLVRLWLATGLSLYRETADRLFAAFAGDVAANVFSHAGLLNALDTRLEPLQVAIVSPGGRAAAESLLRAAWSVSNPRRVLDLVAGRALPEGHPAAGKTALADRPAAFVCRGETCSLPITEPAELAAQLTGPPPETRFPA